MEQLGKAIRHSDGNITDDPDVVEGILLLRKGEQAETTLKFLHRKITELNEHTLPAGVKLVPHLDRSDLMHFTTHTRATQPDERSPAGHADPVSFPVAEVHVHPDYQARGIGRQMVLSLASARSERTAVLSTRDAPTPARRLYRSLGFVDLLTRFMFPGGGPAYAVMGATLPLLDPVR